MTNDTRALVSAVALCALGLLLASCEADGRAPTCGLGTHEVDGACVPIPTEGDTVGGCGPGPALTDAGECESAAGGADTTGPSVDVRIFGDLGSCVPSCETLACGDDGCGGTCGECDDGFHCEDGACVEGELCAPDCRDRACGDDGCGGTCGDCPDDAPFCREGICHTDCAPRCLGRGCGDDGCGGLCGECLAGELCSPLGACVPEVWTCDDGAWSDGASCDCQCGVPDPDCAAELPVVGCGAGQSCDAQGQCVFAGLPEGWTCDPLAYDGGGACNCGCGAPDPDCDAPNVLLVGCPNVRDVCEDGVCACETDCDGRQCGGDGCGGTCGECTTPGADWCDPETWQCTSCTPRCEDRECGPDACGGWCGACTDRTRPECSADGRCVGVCDPEPLACQSAVCGDDGCGGSCGDCADDFTCVGGACLEDIPDGSCRGRCGGPAPSGCSCSLGCDGLGQCCADFVAECPCEPQCGERECGGDGCGGSCGSCPPSTPTCQAGRCRTCVPDCFGRDCGDDGCGGSCGACGDGSTCSASTLRCVPGGWLCDEWTHNAGDGCDCGCGDPDPDCLDDEFVVGCPPGVGCAVDGRCDIEWCSADSDCGDLERCRGTWFAGGDVYDGGCTQVAFGYLEDGAACSLDDECVSAVCRAGLCVPHCRADVDCGPDAVCVAHPAHHASIVGQFGFVGVCQPMAGGAKETCHSHTDCPGAACLVFLDPEAFTPTHRCGPVPLATLDSPCSDSCPSGLACMNDRCRLLCFGGPFDCMAVPGASCQEVVWYDLGNDDTADDVRVEVCLP